MKIGSRRVLLLLLSAFLLLFACGDKKDPAKSPSTEPGMDDALALLPGSPILVGTIDARAFFGSKSFGAELAKLVEMYLPIGQEAGFQASRDVDRVTFASYSYQGVDASAVIVGKFDEAKIKQVAQQQTRMRDGSVIVQSSYMGRDVYTVSNVGFTILSSTHAIAGTEAGIRRVLERIKDKRVRRDIPQWMLQTVETPGAAAAVAVDLGTQPLPAELARQIPVSFVQNMKALRLVATFKEPGLNLAASMTYPDAAAANTASDAVKQAASLSKLLAIFQIKIQNVEVTVDQADVQVKLAVDDSSLRQLLTSVPQWIGPPPQSSSSSSTSPTAAPTATQGGKN
jgi:hypothetical protein